MTFTFETATMARASLKDAGISFKKSLMLANALRGRMSDKAESFLERVQAQKEAVPFTKYANGAGHRKGPMAAGKYPVKAAAAFLSLVRQGVANAEAKGLGTPLKIVFLVANEASRPMRAGRQRGHSMKRTHVELVLAETEESKKREKRQKKAKKAVKADETPEPVAETPKKEPVPKAEKSASARTEEKTATPVKAEPKPVAPKAEKRPVEKQDVPKAPKKAVPKPAEKKTGDAA